MWWKILGPLRLLYKIYFAVVFLVVSILMYPIAIVLVQKKEWRNGLFFFKRNFWVPMMRMLMLIFKKVNYPENFTFPKGPYVVCANHTSYIDIFMFYNVLPGQFVFLSKEEIKKIPMVGLFFRKGIHETVKRGNKADGSRALEKMRERVNEGLPVILFPEGGTSKNPPLMKEFKPGPFKLAIEKQIPILPVTFLNNWQIFSSPAKLFGPARPGISRSVVHPPIETKGMTEKDLVHLQQQVREVIEKDLRKRYPEYFK